MKSAPQKMPVLVRMGDHFLAPDQVAGFKQAKKGLYLILLKQQEEMQFPLWISEREMEAALEYFEVRGGM